MTGIIDTRPFGNLATFRNGVNFSAASRGVGDLAIIGVGDFQKKERLREYGNLERIARPSSLNDDALLRDGDLVFVRSNGNKALIGRCLHLEGVKGDVSHSGFTIRARLKSQDVEPEWITQYFATGLAKREIARRGGGTNISNLSQRILESLPIPIPHQEYQIKVLTIAGFFSEVLEELEKLILAKKNLKKALMQQLLTGDKRFPCLNNQEWVDVTLGDVFTERNERNRPDLQLLSVTNNRGVIPRHKLKKRDTSNPDKSKYKRVTFGDIAYNTMRMWQGVSALSSLEGIVSPAYTIVVPTKHIDGPFARHLFKFPQIVNLFYRSSQGLVDDTLNLKFNRFAKIKVQIPQSMEEQARIGSVLDMCDSEIAYIRALKECYEARKRYHLLRLLCGDIKALSI